MKYCPNCAGAIPILRIARCQNCLVCPCCGTQLQPDRRSQLLMFATLLALFPLALFLARRLAGHTFVFGMFLGLAFGVGAGLLGCLIYAWTVRLHSQGERREMPRSWGGLV